MGTSANASGGGEAGEAASVGDGATGAVLRKAGTTWPATRKSSAGTSSAAARSVPARNQSGTAQGVGYTDFASRRKL
eukprot:5605255-Amphidinium_carterae.1